MMNLTNMINLVDESRYNESNMNLIMNVFTNVFRKHDFIPNCEVGTGFGEDIANTVITIFTKEFFDSIPKLNKEEREELEEVLAELDTDEDDAYELIRDKALNEEETVYNKLREEGLFPVGFSQDYLEAHRIWEGTYMEIWTTQEKLEDMKEFGLLNEDMEINAVDFLAFY